MISRSINVTRIMNRGGVIRLSTCPLAARPHDHHRLRSVLQAVPPDKKIQDIEDDDDEEEVSTDGEVMGFLLTKDIFIGCIAYWVASLQPDISSAWNYDLGPSEAASAVAWGLVPLCITAFCVLSPLRSNNPLLNGGLDGKFIEAAFEQSGEVEVVIGDDNEVMEKLKVKGQAGSDPVKGALDALQCYWLRPQVVPESDTATSLFVIGRTIGIGATEVLIRGLLVGWVANEIHSLLAPSSSSGSLALFMKLAGLNNDGASEAAAVIFLVLSCLPLSAGVQIQSGVRYVRALANKPRADRAVEALREVSAGSSIPLSSAASSERVKEFMKQEGLDPPGLAALLAGSKMETKGDKPPATTSSELAVPFKLSEETKADLEKTSNEIQEALKSIAAAPIESKAEAVKKGQELLNLSSQVEMLARKLGAEGGAMNVMEKINGMFQERERLKDEVKGLMRIRSPEDQVASTILTLLSVSSLVGINAAFCLSGFSLSSSFVTAFVSRVLPIIIIEAKRRQLQEENRP